MIENEGHKKFYISYDTRNIGFDEVDKIHSDMIGTIGGDKVDIHIEDIAFNDDCTAVVIGFLSGSNIDNNDLTYLEDVACRTFEESDKNLHKFIVRFVKFTFL